MIKLIGIGAGGAIGDAVRRGVAGAPGAAANFTVEPDRIYQLANEFESVALRIRTMIAAEANSLVSNAAPGGDKPSRDARERLNETAQGEMGVLRRLIEYATSLEETAVALRQTGEQYGLTDTTEGGNLGADQL